MEFVPIRDRGICRTCVYREKGCLECELDGLPDEHYEGFGWDWETIQRGGSKYLCAYRTGVCNHYLEDEKKVVYCKDCKYGVRFDEPGENGEEWGCTKGRIGTTWDREGECCPCGERKDEMYEDDNELLEVINKLEEYDIRLLKKIIELRENNYQISKIQIKRREQR